MVLIKIITQKIISPILLLLILVGCNERTKEKASLSIVNMFYNDSINNNFCFPEIRDSLSKRNILNTLKNQATYYHIDKSEVLKIDKIKDNHLKSIAEFYEYTVLTDTYIMKHPSGDFLIMIGQSAGATGIGVDFWSYQCYSVNMGEPVLEFSSLIKTPYSVYIDAQGNLNHIEVEDNYQRPANGMEVKLSYIPLLIHIFIGKDKEMSIEFHCKH